MTQLPKPGTAGAALQLLADLKREFGPEVVRAHGVVEHDAEYANFRLIDEAGREWVVSAEPAGAHGI